MKLNISIADELVQRIDKQADSLYMSRSGFISSACAQVLNTTEMMVAIKEVSLAMRKIADTTVIDDESKQRLEDFERMVKLISGVSR